MWKGRFHQETAPNVQQFTESISFDWRLYNVDIQGSMAHAAALEKAGLLSKEERRLIETGLKAIEEEIANDRFQFKIGLEDIHMNIESALTERIGPAGAKLHTARSRNDQIALDLRLYLRSETDEIRALLAKLQRALVRLAEKYPDAILPGYTHLQRAQPVLFGHHLLAYVEMLERDRERLADARKRINCMPLGSGAIAGSTIELDRQLIAELLSFSEVTRNSMDAVSDRDFVAEFLFAIAMIGVHLSRLSEDFVLFATSEFGFVKLSDAYSTGSSLMPQKKNPDVCELARGKSGRLIGNLVSLLSTLKGLPMTYNRDLQEDKQPVFDSIDQIKLVLEVYTEMLTATEVDPQRMRNAASDPGLLATDLADYLVLHHVPFRQAHEIIGKLVAYSLEQYRGFDQMSLDEFRQFSESFGPDVFEVLNLDRAIDSRTGIGAPSRKNVAAALEAWNAILRENP
ncbi:MAG TPA: argininosuccinate lyase [Chthoniobacterales bacterium]|jgi:argininosuccinate lyase|nr:argininosuccinate lyase [Chthoniobacterales bacterium]